MKIVKMIALLSALAPMPALAQNKLGDKFTYGDFHDVILKSGPVPLAIMEERVDAWIAEKE